ncbi:MAG: hypothetical protein CBB69_010400 [Phycisphaera sp. TMED9]|nr:MAG: hypothetical protein CBB69_010400 [Phycisphaera sp. TMED9]
MIERGDTAAKDPGDDAMLDGVIEKWPVDSRKAGDALHLYRTVTLLTIALEGVVGLALLCLATIMLLPVWESLEVPDLHPAVGFILLFAAMVISFEIGRQLRIRRRLRLITRNLSADGTTTCPRCGTVPFAAASCCRLAPEGWSRLDLQGFWHEIAVGRSDPPTGWFQTLRDAGITPAWSRPDTQTRNAWQRGRGPLGTSLQYPRARPVPKSIRWTLRWWQLLGPLLFVPITVLVAIPLVTQGGPIDGRSLVIVALFGTAAIWGVRASIKRLRTMSPIGGTTLPRCAGCGYRLHPPFPDRCPECGDALGASDAITLLPGHSRHD